jgi:hypothetical protein
LPDPEPAKRLYSRRDGVSLGNPFGLFVVGRPQVEATMERAAASYGDGRATGFEPSPRLAGNGLN